MDMDSLQGGISSSLRGPYTQQGSGSQGHGSMGYIYAAGEGMVVAQGGEPTLTLIELGWAALTNRRQGQDKQSSHR